MFAFKSTLQNTRYPALNQTMKSDQLPDSLLFYSYPLCHRESRSKSTAVMAQKEVQMLPNEEKRDWAICGIWHMHQICPKMKGKKSLS